ncbi:MAG: methylmalonyl-CoA epimerase [Candidatus Neomarinimicrobiota bacterium]|nr:MAG: methylmalonyl-CoA epimerase [Candidatus Neomarinimicrobiota bacterium]
MKILNIEHIGIAVGSGDKSRDFWEKILSLTMEHEERVAGQGVDTLIYPVGPSKIELLAATGPDSPVAKYLAKHGPGIHHVCLEVEDIKQAIKELKQSGIQPVFPTPQPGVEQTLVTFIHPRDTGGVLVELAQKGGTGSHGQE